ncbi:MAG: SDR family oxidoreductase [Acidobacteriaceae bacterium]|nr:SDR family oxidoreductase [Acidobacteriaceae bacterium]
MERTLVAITGASSGIGEAFARRLAAGHDLLLIARRHDRLAALAEELHTKHGCNAEVLAADLTQENELSRVAERIGADERLALLINNAGFGTKGRFWEASLESQEQMHRLHVMAVVRLTYAALRNMVPRDFGGIINVASVSAFVRSPGSASYSATKTWMTAFTETVYLELKSTPSNVAIQALCPGFTYSEFHDKLGAQRGNLAPRTWWHSADEIVEASLEGLRRRKLFVMPGWRYRVLTAITTRLPTPARLFFELAATRSRQRELTGPSS